MPTVNPRDHIRTRTYGGAYGKPETVKQAEDRLVKEGKVVRK